MCICDVCVCEWMESSSACLERVDIAFLQVTTIFSAHVATPHPHLPLFPTPVAVFTLCMTRVFHCACAICVQSAAQAPRLEEYQKYLQYELSEGDPARIQCLFERALLENCLVPELWIQYTKYLVSCNVSLVEIA